MDEKQREYEAENLRLRLADEAFWREEILEVLKEIRDSIPSARLAHRVKVMRRLRFKEKCDSLIEDGGVK